MTTMPHLLTQKDMYHAGYEPQFVTCLCVTCLCVTRLTWQKSPFLKNITWHRTNHLFRIVSPALEGLTIYWKIHCGLESTSNCLVSLEKSVEKDNVVSVIAKPCQLKHFKVTLWPNSTNPSVEIPLSCFNHLRPHHLTANMYSYCLMSLPTSWRSNFRLIARKTPDLVQSFWSWAKHINRAGGAVRVIARNECEGWNRWPGDVQQMQSARQHLAKVELEWIYFTIFTLWKLQYKS